MHWTCDISGNVSAGCVGDNDAWSGVVSHPDAIPVTTSRGRRLTMPKEFKTTPQKMFTGKLCTRSYY